MHDKNHIEYLNLALVDFKEMLPAKTPHFFNFKSDTMGDGTMGFFSPKTGIFLFYASILPDRDFRWKSDKIEQQEKVLFFNYILNAPLGMRTSIDDLEAKETLSSRTLLIDGTNAEHKTLKLIGNERFEIFQIAMSEKTFHTFINNLLPKVTDEIKQYIQSHSYKKESMGLLLPFDVKEERCIREIVNCPTKPEFQYFFTLLKINELMMHYFSRIINREILNIVGGENIPLSERDKIVEIKLYIDGHLNDSLDIKALSKMVGLSGSRIKKVFQEMFGYTIIKYHRKKRLNQAYMLLVDFENRKTVKEITFTLGFTSISSFSRAFFQEFRIRPSEINKVF